MSAIQPSKSQPLKAQSLKAPPFKVIQTYTHNDSLVQYGDGIFETMLVIDGRVHQRDYHWRRLSSGCQRLGMPLLTKADFEAIIQQALTDIPCSDSRYVVIKLILSRGEGMRGYQSIDSQPCYFSYSVSPYAYNSALYQGLNVRICQMKLAQQPVLAGMKHCNRLEYVLARREPADKDYHEGLLFDTTGLLIEGLISNVFLVADRRLLTPDLTQAGVAGTMRAHLLDKCQEKNIDVAVMPIDYQMLARADAVFVTNAVMGVQPVRHIQSIDKVFSVDAVHPFKQMVDHPCADF
ncbi:aminodeoxychorismate lyase [Ostreibacterium oceani]|uniref:Aminodeoxychorismate lyase n=1 Tax=Ostreibacterium oceani TaxID=2654998 RepID=A0A6N7EZ35_9GAMM|nr:aminodeoxychorismate lyase [Ostreibacterium oceani]MPV86820.1 aminodeoxychorismate lyase [Ostreibacterium oceani]